MRVCNSYNLMEYGDIIIIKCLSGYFIKKYSVYSLNNQLLCVIINEPNINHC